MTVCDPEDLRDAARADDVEFLNENLNEELPITVLYGTDVNGNTALHMAAANGSVEAMKAIIKHTQDKSYLSFMNKSKNTPLHWACLNGQLECVRLLLEAHAPTSMKNEQGRTPVALASMYQHTGIEDLFLQYFADNAPENMSELDEADTQETNDNVIDAKVESENCNAEDNNQLEANVNDFLGT